jgi:hypothetical protein
MIAFSPKAKDHFRTHALQQKCGYSLTSSACASRIGGEAALPAALKW